MRVVTPARAASVVIGSSQVRGARADVVAHGQGVGEEDGIEQAGFRLAGEVGVVADVGQRQRRGGWMAPCGLVVAAAMDEEVEVKLARAVGHVFRSSPLPRPPPAGGGGSITKYSSHVEVRDLQRVADDEVAARLDHVAHQRAEYLGGVLGVADLHLQQRAHRRIERGVP